MSLDAVPWPLRRYATFAMCNHASLSKIPEGVELIRCDMELRHLCRRRLKLNESWLSTGGWDRMSYPAAASLRDTWSTHSPGLPIRFQPS
jgi:hypothetical protein